MGKETKIQWSDSTWNPWEGCHKVSAGCMNCYMFRDMKRWGKNPKIPRRTSDKTFNSPLHWKSAQRIFTCSWSDFFIAEADSWRPDAYNIIERTPQHEYLILTKRPERYPVAWPYQETKAPENIWLGVSAETSDLYEKRVGELAKINAAIKFVSIEPLLAWVPLDLSANVVDWVIVGGESGNKTGKFRYRKCELELIEIIVAECRHYGVPCFVKQLGSDLANRMGLKDKKGGDMEEWPEHLRVREFPIFKPKELAI